MKLKLRILYASIVVICSSLFLIQEFSESGQLKNDWLRRNILPITERITTSFTDFKFRIRGPVPVKSKIVIVDIDDNALKQIGRWPWSRDITVWLLEKIFNANPKVVALDIVFSEPQKDVPEELEDALRKRNLHDLLGQFQADKKLASLISQYRDRLVLAWQANQLCTPAYSSARDCNLAHSLVPDGFGRFSVSLVQNMPQIGMESPVPLAAELIPNIDLFNAQASFQGFVNGDRGSDGVIRKNLLLAVAQNSVFPSLGLETARVALGEKIGVRFDEAHRISGISFLGIKREIPVSPLGVMETNFRGPDRSFIYLPATELLSDSDLLSPESSRELASQSKSEILRDAIVLVGVSALAVGDIISTPFVSTMAGVEVHANVIDNILNSDMLISQATASNRLLIICFLLLIMLIGGFSIGLVAETLSALPAVGLFVVTFILLGFIDTKILFSMNQNWNTSFFFVELLAVMFTVLIAKYVLEEKEKRFIKLAMGKYVSTSVVDLVMKEPKALELGGTKKNLSILFSDIRGFTTFSESMDATNLANFLNDYLGLMTQVVFDCGGTIDKYIGDAIMAFFGAPVDQADHANQACKAAVLMQQRVDENRFRFQEKYGVDVQIGVGVNSGIVSVGNMGTDNKFSYTVIGDQVNLASRVESATKQYGVKILTTHFTLGEIQEHNDIPPLYRVVDIVKLKGKNEAVQLIELSNRGWSEEGLMAFDDAREDYRGRKWDTAIELFRKAGIILAKDRGEETDPVCELYIDRCQHYRVMAPQADWDGSFLLDSK